MPDVHGSRRRRLVAVLAAAALGATGAGAVVIDNDLPATQEGHWSVDVMAAGDAREAFVVPLGSTTAEDVVFEYLGYVDPGAIGSGRRLEATSGPTASGNDQVTSTGSFTGANGNTIDWTAVSSIENGSLVMTTTLTFTAQSGTLGVLRYFSYLDSDVRAVSEDDVLAVRGSAASGDLQLLTISFDVVVGASHSGAYSAAQGLENASFAGWAADKFQDVQLDILFGPIAVSPTGMLDTTDLPPFDHPLIENTYGQGDITSVLAWDLDPDATSATVVIKLGGVPGVIEETPLSAHFAASCPGACTFSVGEPIAFVDSSTGADSWEYDWDGVGGFEDGGHGAPVTMHTYATPGQYRPRLRVRRGGDRNIFEHEELITIEGDGPVETPTATPIPTPGPTPTPTTPAGSPPAAPTGLTAQALTQSAVLLEWGDNSNNEQSFGIEVRMGDAGVFAEAASAPANSTLFAVEGLAADTDYTFRVRARNASGDSQYSNNAFATTAAGPLACVQDANTACLLGGRFRVSGQMRNFANPPVSFLTLVMTFPGGRAESDQAVFFESFTAGNFEVGVKMVDGCGFPDGNPLRNFWVFAGGLTNAKTDITVEDTVTGAIYHWNNPANTFPTSIGDTMAFPCVDVGMPGDCVPDANSACLIGGRFRVTGTMDNFADPPVTFTIRVIVFAQSRAETDQAVFFESFASGNFEVGVKMVDGCGFPQGSPLHHVWVFYGGLTTAYTEIRVIDIQTGAVDIWRNPANSLPTTEGRTMAFDCD